MGAGALRRSRTSAITLLTLIMLGCAPNTLPSFAPNSQAQIVEAGRIPSAPEVKSRYIGLHITGEQGTTLGSAFPWRGTLLVTNAHVVRGVPNGGMITAMVANERVDVQVYRRSPTVDIALLCLPRGMSLPSFPTRVAQPRRGEAVFSTGLSNPTQLDRQITVSGTVITEKYTSRPFGEGWIALLPGATFGFSGAPVQDERGNLLGMLTAIRNTQAEVTSAIISHSTSSSMTFNAQREAFIISYEQIEREINNLMGHYSGKGHICH